MLPLIAGICPTYKRPKMLQNLAACFQAQNYDSDLSYLVILDDAAQFSLKNNCDDDRIHLVSQQTRFENLPDKFNKLISLSDEIGIFYHGRKPDLYVVMEDDDVYLPYHFSVIAETFKQVLEVENRSDVFLFPSKAFSNYAQSQKSIIEEPATGRFHGSWAYSRDLIEKTNGYIGDSRLSFDVETGQSMSNAGIGVDYAMNFPEETPTYCYRWGSYGNWNGSSAGNNYSDFYEQLASLKSEFIGKLIPRFDTETKRIIRDVMASIDEKGLLAALESADTCCPS